MTFNFSFEVAGNPFLSSLSTTTTSDLKSLSRLAPSVVVREFLVCLRGLLADKLPHRASRFSTNVIGSALKDVLLHATNHDWKLMVVLAITSMLLVTYLATSMQAALAMRNSKQHGKRPPILPYWIPFLGSLIPYFWDGPLLAAKAVDKFGQSVPAGLRLGHVKLYLVGDPDLVNAIFKPTPATSSNLGMAIAMKAVLGTPNHIVPLYSGDDSGQLLKSIPGSQVRPENRIRFFHTKATHQHLAGTNGIRLGERYVDILSRNVSTDTTVGTEWVEFPDLWLFIRDLVFPASTEAMCGSFLLSHNPTLTEDFWAFDQSIPTLLKGLPRWLSPGAYKSRDKVLNAIKKWHTFANEHSDRYRTGPNDPEWDPYFGCKYVKARQRFLHEIEVMDADGRASEDLGFLFAATGNSVTAVYWATFEVFTRPDLLSRVRDIAQSAHDTSAQESESVKLGSNPLLQSIFAEVTRLRVVGMIVRVITGGDFQLGEWSIPQGSIVGLPSRTGAMNKDVWNAGTKEDPHPLEDFWEERFLIYPDNPNSGPLRKKEIAPCHSKQEPTACSSTPGKAPGEPTFSLKGLNGAYTPFGGGPGPCPGRHFARQEVTCTLAKLVLEYDMELQVSKGWEPKMDTSFFPLGTLPPKDKVPFRVRRRLP